MSRTKKVVKYVAEMYDRSDEYDTNPIEVHRNLQEDELLGEIYNGIVGERICTVCEKSKMYDEKNKEFYCPKHD